MRPPDKAKAPARGDASGATSRKLSLAASICEITASVLAAQRLARRFALTPPTARVVVALAGLGEVQP